MKWRVSKLLEVRLGLVFFGKRREGCGVLKVEQGKGKGVGQGLIAKVWRCHFLVREKKRFLELKSIQKPFLTNIL